MRLCYYPDFNSLFHSYQFANMENFTQLKDYDERELVAGFNAKLIHMEGMTIAHVHAKEGAILPEHFHIHEQVTNIIQGKLEMTMNGKTRVCEPGDVVMIPSNLPHSARALTDCYVIDCFQPVREDYK